MPFEGNLFKYHANLLEKERNKGKHEKVFCKTEPSATEQDVHVTEVMDSKTGIKEEVSTPGSRSLPEKQGNSEELADQMFIEAQDLLLNSPWIANIEMGGEKEKHMDKECEFKVKKETKEIYPNPYDKYDNDVDNITDIHFTSEDLVSDMNDTVSVSIPKAAGYTSVIQKFGHSQ